jgi:hypothetical protein
MSYDWRFLIPEKPTSLPRLDVGPRVSSLKNRFFTNLYGIPHGVSRYRRRRRAGGLAVSRYDPAVESAEEDA